MSAFHVESNPRGEVEQALAKCRRSLVCLRASEQKGAQWACDFIENELLTRNVDPEFRFSAMADPCSFMVNGSFTVHNFGDDPEMPRDRRSEKWGAYVVGSDWLVGFDTKEEAARAGWDAIMAATKR